MHEIIDESLIVKVVMSNLFCLNVTILVCKKNNIHCTCNKPIFMSMQILLVFEDLIIANISNSLLVL